MLSSSHRSMVVAHPLGFHLRAAGKFAELAQGFEADVRVSCNGKEACGKSIIELMLLAAECGAVLEVEASGPDADGALEQLIELVVGGFGETDQDSANREVLSHCP